MQNTNKMLITNCSNCLSCDVCKFKDSYNNTVVTTEHPFLRVSCSEYHDNNIMIVKKDIGESIKYWRILNPDGTKKRCSEELGISRPTVYKY